LRYQIGGLQQIGPGGMIAMTVRWQGSLDRPIQHIACRRAAALTTRQIITEMPPEAAATAASRVLSMRWPPPLPSARRVAGFRLTATDTSWLVGEGPSVRGLMAALLLLCCGRLAALPQLSGDGATELSARLAAPARA
jgi:hypothetical protein